MGLYLNPGNDGFKISSSSDIYIDKTSMIAFTNKRIGQEKRFICVSRPRRFGKSMAANMLSAYYCRECDSSQLFSKYNIAKDKSFQVHLNKYDVLFFNMQQFLSGAKTTQNLVPYIQNNVISELKETYGDWVPQNQDNLALVLAKIYSKSTDENKGFIIIIDEWDCIFREYKDDKIAQKEYLDFLKDLLKDRTYVKLAYMTGILPVKKYGTHSALNIFDEFSMTEPKSMAKYMGFTQDEVKKLCKKYKMDFNEANHWYDGYCLKNVKHVYNPKSIVDAMTESEFHSYWTSTETYEALKIYIDMNFDGLKDSIIAMLGGIPCKIDTSTFQNDMTSATSKDDCLTLLVHLGYLAFDEEKNEVFIPNEEIRREFLTAIKQCGWNFVINAVSASEKLLQATLNCESENVAIGIDEVHTEQTSILSYNDENSLSCVITLAYFSAQKDYNMYRELPSGLGFADIVFVPRRTSDKPAIVVELKYDKSASGAIEQIKNKQYVKALEKYTGDILLVGVNYSKKSKKHECCIERLKL
jgi:hypothetical protein